MGVCVEPAGPEVHELAMEVVKAWHPHLARQGFEVRLCILMAFHDDESKGSAVKQDGYDVAASVKVIPYRQRVDDRKDAEFSIDRETWENLSVPCRKALLDSCCSYLEIQTDENKCVKTDDWGRPKLKLRNADWHLRGFAAVANRHGEHALEVQAAREFQEKFGNVLAQGAPLFS